MTSRLITPPAAPAVSIEAARRIVRTTSTSLDAELEGKLYAITEEAEHLTNRAFIQQTWEVTLDAFPAEIPLAPAPLASVTSVQYYDVAGTLQTLGPQQYLVDEKSEPGRVLPAPGVTWPDTAERFDAVQVRFVCGYGADDTAVPKAIQDYILGMLENRYYPNPNAQYLCRRLDRYWVPL